MQDLLLGLREGAAAIFVPHVLLTIALSAVYGICVGAIPGLTATMAVALLVPITFFLGDVEAIAAIVTTVTCSIFAGDIPATLVRIPGTPASAAYANDAYALTRRGLYQRALCTSLIFSVFGGLVGVIVLISAAPQLARLATQFGSYENFWLYVLGLTCAAVVSDESRLRGVVSLGLGLLFSSVGLAADYSVPRLTLGMDQLVTGINFIPAMIGLFGISEVLRNSLVVEEMSGPAPLPRDEAETPRAPPGESLRGALTGSLVMVGQRWMHLLRSSTLGAVVGMLPGAGADIAAWISYAVSKRFAQRPEDYGHGSLEGLADATGANNAALGGAWIPALVFGIPGDSVTAIAIGVLLMKNIRPGPEIFEVHHEASKAHLVYGIYFAFILANVILMPLGLLSIRASSWLVSIPRRVLLPVITVFCVVGAYAMNGRYFDVYIMLAMGLLGFVLEMFRFPLGPVVLGIILGGELEHRFIQCITREASLAPFFSGAISLTLGGICLALWLSPLLFRRTATRL